MKDFKPYMVKFEEDDKIKPRIYPSGCTIGTNDWQPIIVITNDKFTFSTNDGIKRAWTRVRDTFLQPKSCGQGIMTLEFLLPFGRLNLASLSLEKKDEVVEKCGLVSIKAVEIFEYRKNNDGYWDGAKLHLLVMKKVLPIAEALYPRYSLLFLFDNATNHSIYAKDALQVKDINKNIGDKQPQLRNGWYNLNRVQSIQLMNFQDKDKK